MYTNAAQVSNFLKRDLSSDEKATLASMIPSVCNWIDMKTRTTFVDTSATPTQRYYQGGDQYIDIEPATNITALELIDDYGVVNYNYQTFEFVTLPTNFNVKTQVKYRYGKFPSGTSRLRVTGIFSSYDNGVPDDIQMVAARLCVVLINLKLAQNVSREALEGHMIMYQQHLDNVGVNDPFIVSVLSMRTELQLG